jgi:lysophospholipase L1-like esterase
MSKIPADKQGQYYTSDKVHFNAEGCKLMSEIIMKSVQKDIEEHYKSLTSAQPK